MTIRRNILFITTDMQRPDTLGCYGNPIVGVSPHVDRLASQGLRFDAAFANNPVCMPSRATLFTGRMPSSHGVIWNGCHMRPDELTFTKLLRDAGYQTAAIGKMHVGPTVADLGLDHLVLADHYHSKSYLQYLKAHGLPKQNFQDAPGYHEKLGAVASPLPPEHHLDGFIAGETVKFLAERNRSRPFFCWCSFHGPHLPIDPSPPFDTMIDPATVPLPEVEPTELDGKPPEQRAFQQNVNRGNGFGDYRRVTGNPNLLRHFTAMYWGKCAMLDALVGKVLAALEASGEADNTLIVFTSDHGDFVGRHGLMFKSAFGYDDILHVPFIVAGPGVARDETASDFAELADVPATFLSLAGVSSPRPLHGVDLLPRLQRGEPVSRDLVYAEACDKRIVRTRGWKLVHYAGRSYGELYDLAADPGEMINRYNDPAAAGAQADLYRRLADRMADLPATTMPQVRMLELPHPDDPACTVSIPWI